jgi:hypothetical protein
MTLNNTRKQDLEKEKFFHERRLQLLKEKKTIQGINVDPAVQIEIEQIEEILEQLYVQLETEKIKEGILEVSTLTTGIPKLREDKFQFLYLVYIKAETDIFRRVELDEIMGDLGLPQLKVISIGQYLTKKGLVKFRNWYEGIWIVHPGIVKVETDLLRMRSVPEYVASDEIKQIQERLKLRFALLRHLYEKVQSDTFEQVFQADLAKELELDHNRVITQLIPYLASEGWIKVRTNDSVAITEEGIERVELLLS